MATISIATRMEEARTKMIEDLKLNDLPYRVDGCEYGKVIESGGQQIAVTVKVIAHKLDYDIEAEAVGYAEDKALKERKAAERKAEREEKARLAQEKKAAKAAEKAAQEISENA